MDTSIPTKKPVVLYHRNPLECLEALFQSPLLKDHIGLGPYQLYESAAKLMRVFTEWLSGYTVGFMQVCIQ